MFRIAITGIFFVLLLFPSTAREGPDVPDGSKNKLKEILAVLDGTGEKEYNEPKFYGKNLWQYIDGADVAYHSYDFVALALQRYRSGTSETTVEIYDMGESINAFGIYAAERSPDLNFIKIGAQGYDQKAMLNFYQGRYYVKLSLYAPDERQKSLKEIAVKLSESIGDDYAMPAFYQSFPTENRIENTEQYLKKAPLGHPFLSPAYQVSYKKGDDLFQIVISRAENPQNAVERYLRLKEHFVQSGTVTELGKETFRGENPYEGKMVCRHQASFVLILLNPPEKWQAWMDATQSNLRE